MLHVSLSRYKASSSPIMFKSFNTFLPVVYIWKLSLFLGGIYLEIYVAYDIGLLHGNIVASCYV